MTKETLAPTASAETIESLSESPSKNSVKRRSFLKGLGLAGATLAGGSLLAAASETAETTGVITSGDVALLRFVAAAELIETDMWQQYAELGGLTPGQLPVETAPFTPMNTYQAAFMNLDSDGPQYITSNTNDELTHAEFLNAYLISIGAEPVDFDAFRTLPSSQATGAQQIGRLTNLMNLTVDNSWYTRYRSTLNPDFGATFRKRSTWSTCPGFPSQMRISSRNTTFRQLPTPRLSTSERLSKGAARFTPPSFRRPQIWKFCEFWSALGETK
jgi:hypothetical protein